MNFNGVLSGMRSAGVVGRLVGLGPCPSLPLEACRFPSERVVACKSACENIGNHPAKRRSWEGASGSRVCRWLKSAWVAMVPERGAVLGEAQTRPGRCHHSNRPRHGHLSPYWTRSSPQWTAVRPFVNPPWQSQVHVTKLIASRRRRSSWGRGRSQVSTLSGQLACLGPG